MRGSLKDLAKHPRQIASALNRAASSAINGTKINTLMPRQASSRQ